MTPGLPDPPSHLSTPSKAWFRKIVAAYELDTHHVELLRLASEALDRAEEARAALRENGLTYVDRFGMPKPRPEIFIERASTITFARLVRELGLDKAHLPDSLRSGELTGYTRRNGEDRKHGRSS
jgi:phage terminase small subunit